MVTTFLTFGMKETAQKRIDRAEKYGLFEKKLWKRPLLLWNLDYAQIKKLKASGTYGGLDNVAVLSWLSSNFLGPRRPLKY